MHWLQDENGNVSLENLQLDIVGFLAILGEGSVLANAQVSTLSKWIYLPRLIPAPQALMRPTRPEKLEPVAGFVTGIFSGNDKDCINHIGNVVCDASNLPEFSVRVVTIRRTDESTPIKAKTVAPVTAVAFIGCAFSVILLAVSIWQDDGMSIVATVLLSLLTSLIGVGNKWTLQLGTRRVKQGNVPLGDVVIRYPKGSFLIVRCEEDVARELYFAPETINYLLKNEPLYRLLSLVGTTMLMGAVICLANARIQTQIAWAAAYMLLGTFYWILAALPPKLHWDTSAYVVENECLSDSSMCEKGFPSHNLTYTQALWRAIVLAKGVDWVHHNRACPDTKAWKEWLREAQDEARRVSKAPKGECHVDADGKEVTTWIVPDWDAQRALGALLSEQADTNKKVRMQESVEEV